MSGGRERDLGVHDRTLNESSFNEEENNQAIILWNGNHLRGQNPAAWGGDNSYRRQDSGTISAKYILGATNPPETVADMLTASEEVETETSKVGPPGAWALAVTPIDGGGATT